MYLLHSLKEKLLVCPAWVKRIDFTKGYRHPCRQKYNIVI